MTIVADVRTAEDIGRRARMELVFADRGGRTRLTHGYTEPPYRVLPGFDRDDGLHVILGSSAPGVFGGDSLEQTVTLEPGANLTLTSQSATQLHPHRSGRAASLQSRYEIRPGASLRCVWEPLIPFAGAALEQRIAIDVARRARLGWMDAMMAGRAGRGERWALASLAHELRLTREGELGYLERFHLRPPAASLTARWIAGDADYLGTGLLIGIAAAVDVAEHLHCGLAALPQVLGAADALADDMVIVRFMSASGAAFHRARQVIRGFFDALLKPDAT
jgi:urease accessory protein